MMTVVTLNSLGLFYTAALDYISIFGWLSPFFAAFPLGIFWLLREKYLFPIKQLISLSIVGILLIGLIGVFNYYSLEHKIAENVLPSEIAASHWLEGKDLVIASDLHFVSTYVTVAGVDARHFLLMDNDISAIRKIYYDVDLKYIKIKSTECFVEGLNSFVVTKKMENAFISHFIGTRTIPNPRLENILSAKAEKLYDSSYVSIFLF
jgi:hypothetical protein